MCGRRRTLEVESFENEVLHAVNLVFRVRVIGDVAEISHIWRCDLLVLAVNNKILVEMIYLVTKTG